MQNKIVLITGGNSGIGKATALELAKMGAEVVITSRTQKRGEKAVREIIKKSGNNDISMLLCDLASFNSIQRLATAFVSRHDRLDILINNAGIFTSKFQRTEEGFEMQFGVNHLGHFLLTHLLKAHLSMSLRPRVVVVSSNAHFRGDINFDRFQGEQEAYNGIEAYAQSKLSNVLFAREFARRYSSIECNSLHPGIVSTKIGNKHSNWWMSLVWQLGKLFMISPAKGARTSVYLASAPELRGVSGEYFDDKQRRSPPSSKALDDNLARKLWDVSEKLIKEVGFSLELPES